MKSVHFTYFCFLTLGFSVAFAVRAQTLPKTWNVPEIMGYTYWRAVNNNPAKMDPAVAVLCAAPPMPAPKPVRGTQGPHQQKWINVFVNPIGENAMLTQKRPQFPVGTVIVKQKLPSIVSKRGDVAGTQPELLTVMIKRGPNYDKASGNWEYMVTDGQGKKVAQRGKLKSCQGCHNPFAKTDYVVRSYLPSSVFKALKDVNDLPASKPK